MKRKILTIFLLFVVSAFAYSQKPSVESKWTKIGSVSASLKKESEAIIVVGQNEFSALRLRVKKASINIERVQIFFEGGKLQEEELTQSLKPGEDTRVIDLYAENHQINKVVFIYKARVVDEGGDYFDVELFGLQSLMDVPVEPTSTSVNEVGDTTMDQGVENSGEVGEASEKTDGEIKDEKLEDKTGPNGETIYVDDNNNYYWLNEDGMRHYISALDLKDKN